MKKRTVLEKQIKQIAKKMNIFTTEDVEILTEKPRVEIAMRLEKMVAQGKLKQNGDCFIHIQKEPPATKAREIDWSQISETPPDDRVRILPFKPKKPKEVYLRRINQIDGYQDYFFAPPAVKKRIQKIIRVLKETHGMKKTDVEKVVKDYGISIRSYYVYKKEILTNGLSNLALSKRKTEPGEIFYFFKEYYLSPKKYSAAEARQLAINKFEQMTGIDMFCSVVSSSSTMYKKLLQEYSSEDIQKYRTPNFSEFDMESFLKL